MTEYEKGDTATSPWEAERNIFNKRLLAEAHFSTEVATNIMNKIIDEFIVDMVVECRRAVKMDYVEFLPVPKCENRPPEETPLEDHSKVSQKEMIKCPNCYKTYLTINFGVHLEKCMGMSRKSSRLANKRISMINKSQYSGLALDDEDDEEELPKPPKSSKKVVKRKHDKKRVKGDDGGRARAPRPDKMEPSQTDTDLLASSLARVVDLDLLDMPSLGQEDDRPFSLESPAKKKSK